MIDSTYRTLVHDLIYRLDSSLRENNYPSNVISTLLTDMSLVLTSLYFKYNNNEIINKTNDLINFFKEREHCNLYFIDKDTVKSTYDDWVDSNHLKPIILSYIPLLQKTLLDTNQKRIAEADIINSMKVNDDYIYSQDDNIC